MKVAVIKYNAGNVQSIAFALNRLGLDPVITDNKDIIGSADRVIFPGVGEAKSAISYLDELGLLKVIPSLEMPFLGICLGMQLMCSSSSENDAKGLNIFDEQVIKILPTNKVPHMGWNALFDIKGALYKGVDQKNSYVYFAHSYFVRLNSLTNAKTDYGSPFSAGLEKNNFYAVQFHPEKSGDVGQIILKNFIELEK
ncbi:MAG: imidazole glycerol phosphate synthase subunit HisH [Bacteriovoracaceae bacterium]|nr:imidazole glycerol phosphate synthase subunit HisH [Bacteriovoracaceae bacterium]